MGRIEVSVDDGEAKTVENDCPSGGCAFSDTFTFDASEYEQGAHTIRVTATDQAGNNTTREFVVNAAAEPDPGCGPAPTPSTANGGTTVTPQAALDSFKAARPEAFDTMSSLSLGGSALVPSLASTANELTSQSSIDAISIDTRADDGVTLKTGGDMTVVCMTPTEVGPSASGPTSIISGSSVLFANSLPSVDTAYRTNLVGTERLSQIRDSAAPTEQSWNVDLQPDQQLEKLSDGNVAIVAPIADGEANPADSGLAALPTSSDQIAALKDPELQASQATHLLEHALEGTGNEIVGLIAKPWARDASGSPVATSLDVSGSRVTMNVSHRSTGVSYPVVTDSRVVMADALDEYEAQRADDQTASYSDDEADSFQPGATTSSPAPSPAADATGDVDFAGDYSSLDQDSYSEAEAEGSVAEADAAGKSPYKPRIALTESNSALFFDAQRQPLGATGYRPIVPWRVVQMMTAAPVKPNDAASRAKAADDRNRAALWAQWYEVTRPGGRRGVESDGEASGGIKTDVAFQFADTDKRAPKVIEYKKALTAFFARYSNVVGNVTPWNEPQLANDQTGKKNPGRNNPVRAARYWLVAQHLCHPAGGAARCGNVIAGEYAGRPYDQKYKLDVKTADAPERRQPRKGSFQGEYRRYLYSEILRDYKGVEKRAKAHYPKVWGFHAYADTNRYELTPKATKAPVTEFYVKKFRQNEYRNARIWLTAVGAFYKRACKDLKPSLAAKPNYCGPNFGDKDSLTLGTKRQRNATAALFRRIGLALKPPNGKRGVEAVFHYPLHDTAGSAEFKGRGSRVRDSGLVGADGPAPGEVQHFLSGDIGRSTPGRRNPVFCTFRDRGIYNRPAVCPE